MQRRISLNGNDWQLKDYYGEDWRWRNAHKTGTRDTHFWRKGTVPGSVHNDLWDAGEIPNPYFERNSLLLEWIPARTWLYKKAFVVDEELRGKRIQLHFEGVDYAAEFFLNGESLGHHSGMFTPAVFEVSEQLQYGAENLLSVVIEPAPHEQPQVSRTSKVSTHKSRMTYWWDFCPRMIHVGIWDDVYLAVSEQVRIEDVFVRPQLADDFLRAEISVSTELDALQNQVVEVETQFRFEGEVVTIQRTRHALPTGRMHLNVCLPIDRPELWWPNGYGEQPLYTAEVSVFPTDDADYHLDDHIVKFGIRKVELVSNETDDTTALPYTFVVNGRKVYIKGWNWVPIDVMYGVPRPEKLENLLQLAQRARVNMLRIWGGGLIEKQAFYDVCDQLGIMVWQEFIQSSSGIENYAPDTLDFINMMVREAEQIIPRKRNHPSLVWWCGGNELSSGPEQPLDDNHPLLSALKATVARLDPDRFWLPTSPTGRVFLNSLENIENDQQALHDVHGPWEYQGVTKQYELYNRSTSLLHSEFGVEGITNLKTLNATVAPEHQWPTSLDNPIWQHLGAWWNQQDTWREVFGDVGDVKTLVRATQYMQAEGLRYAVEADRRRKYQNSGTLPWQFNEPYPMATCTSSVDYYAQPKPVYYAVAHAYEPVHVSAKFPTVAWEGIDQFEAELWVNNSLESSFEDATVTAKIIGSSGRVYGEWQEAVAFQPNSAAQISFVLWVLDGLDGDIFFLDLRLTDDAGKVLSINRYAFTHAANLSPLLDTPTTTLAIQKEEHDDGWILTLTNDGEQAALFIQLEDGRDVGAAGFAYFDKNHFCLFPKESISVSILWRNVPLSERRIDMNAWNTQTYRIE
jgi:beta-mannosidase